MKKPPVKEALTATEIAQRNGMWAKLWADELVKHFNVSVEEDAVIMNKLLGYTPGQWVTVFKKFPPKTFDLQGVAEAQKRWKQDQHPIGWIEPIESKVTPGFGTAWDRFVAAQKGML